jgi:hypothetical protein
MQIALKQYAPTVDQTLAQFHHAKRNHFLSQQRAQRKPVFAADVPQQCA